MGRAGGRIASAKSASAAASSRLVLASLPVARAKSRIWRGVTTASGSSAAASALATTLCYPPVAAMTIRAGASAQAKLSAQGRRCTSSRSLDASIPTKPSLSPPCACGLDQVVRPRGLRRLFWLREPADGAPCSEAGLSARGAKGLPSAHRSAQSTPAPRPCTDARSARRARLEGRTALIQSN